MLHSGQAATGVANDLKLLLNNRLITWFVQGFTTLCIVTSFLGVSLSLTDFLADGLKVNKRGKDGMLVYSLTFIPPLLIVLFYPNAFIMGLSYAGMIVILLLILLPALMVWRGRYIKKLSSSYEVVGGRFALIATVVVSIALLTIEFMHLKLP